ncbi:MAG: heme-binding domain-containing protein, partial [Armatimonadota bacterium]
EKAREIWEEVEKGRMPLRSYLLAHPSARLSQTDRDVLRNWATNAAAAEKGAEKGQTAISPRREESAERERHHEERGE